MKNTHTCPALSSLVGLALFASCQGPVPGPDEGAPNPERALDWTVGAWEGVRRDAADGDEAPMVMRVAEIMDGAGQTREMEIVHDGGVYRGFCVQVYDPSLGCWVRQYVNDVRRRYARLEGTVEGERSVWRGASAERTRESRVVSERTAPDTWRRTMSVSEDGGETWRPLWIDELVRRGTREAGPRAVESRF